MGFCRKSWIEAGGTEKVDCQGSLRDEAVPEIQGEVGVAATEAGHEVILVGLDGWCNAGVEERVGNRRLNCAEMF